MRQEINLLQFAPVADVPRLSFMVLLSCLAVFFLMLVAVAWSGKQDLHDVLSDIDTIEKDNSFRQAAAMKTDDISKHQTQLQALEVQLLSKYQLWSSYKKITDAGKNGFSQHFYHIANVADGNLSLYEIDIYERGTRLALKGYARKAEYIPVYINDLKNKQEFESVFFGDLSIEKLKGHEVMRFALEKKVDKKDKKESIDGSIDKNINVSDLLKMSLATVLKKQSVLGVSNTAVTTPGVQP
jgi:hypothetical protein